MAAPLTREAAAPNAPVPPQNLDPRIAWAAGLFEGEGCFSLKRRGCPTIALAMSDKDVVDRFHDIVACGKVYSKKTTGTKPMWAVQIAQSDEVLRVIEMFRPFLGQRRAARADELAAELRARVDLVTRERTCPECHRSFRPLFASNAARQRFCTRACTKAWHERQYNERRRVGNRV